jgi:hypothetical protein
MRMNDSGLNVLLERAEEALKTFRCPQCGTKTKK